MNHLYPQPRELRRERTREMNALYTSIRALQPDETLADRADAGDPLALSFLQTVHKAERRDDLDRRVISPTLTEELKNHRLDLERGRVR